MEERLEEIATAFQLAIITFPDGTGADGVMAHPDKNYVEITFGDRRWNGAVTGTITEKMIGYRFVEGMVATFGCRVVRVERIYGIVDDQIKAIRYYVERKDP